MYSPDSIVNLCSVPLEADQKNQLHFSSVSAQTNYFEGTVVESFDDFTFVRRDSVIRVNRNIEDLYNCNYVMYQNSHFTDKWFYAFITELEYLNDAVTAIHIKTDVFQTWMFDTDILPSFVVREHVNNDAIGANTIPEGLEIGPYVVGAESTISLNSDGYKLILATTLLDTDNYGGSLVQGVYSGVQYLYWDLNNAGISGINNYIKDAVENNKIDGIIAIMQAPSDVVNAAPGMNLTMSGAPTNFDGYVPVNNKLRTFPYCYLGVTAHLGEEKVYRYELWNGVPTFSIVTHMSLNPKAMVMPQNYRNRDYETEDSLTFSPFTQCTWISDTFAQWYASRQNQLRLGVASDVLQAVGGAVSAVASGGAIGLGSVASGIGGIFSTMAQVNDIKTAAPQFNGSGNNDSANIYWGLMNVEGKGYTITAEYARCIDEYFSMFGYKVNRVKVPNIATRKNWNYVQTIDIQITGDIPNDDMEELRQIYNNGVTIWNNPSTFGDYSQANGIV